MFQSRRTGAPRQSILLYHGSNLGSVGGRVTGRAYREREEREAVIKREYTVLSLRTSSVVRYHSAVPIWNLDTDYGLKVGFAILSRNCEGNCHLLGCGTVWSRRNSVAFRRTVLFPSSGSKWKPKRQELSRNQNQPRS
jgi:hypothetical protein